MYNKLQLVFKYAQYWFTASNGRGHGIHSPFVFDLIKNVLNDRRRFYAYEQVEKLRDQLLQNDDPIGVEDFGAGSVVNNSGKRKIGDIARYAAKPVKWGQLLFRIVNYYQPKNIIDIGTSLGITTAYLASANAAATVITLEGAAPVAELAVKNFYQLGLTNIKLVMGNFDETLPAVIGQQSTTGFVFFDGNHKKEATLRYFETCLSKTGNDSIFVFDDIHWSSEMEAAWKIIKQHPSVKLSIDLFFIGIIFFRKEFKEVQHFSIRF
jgi:predicted O-methyltransferase YrrM